MNNYYQIQHLDVKPQNLFLVFNHIKVADFGLAKVLEGVKATVTGGVTPVYAAPETFEGWVSRFSDQYSLAIVFQELLTGTRPFNGANTRQLLMQHINGTPDMAAMPVADRPVLARGLNKSPNDRWISCAAMIAALKRAGTQPPPPLVSPPAPAAQSPSPPRGPISTMPAGPGESDSVHPTRPAPGARPALDLTAPTKAHTPHPAGL